MLSVKKFVLLLLGWFNDVFLLSDVVVNVMGCDVLKWKRDVAVKA